MRADCTDGTWYTCASIIKALKFLKDGFRARIGKGEVSLFFDKILDERPICQSLDYVHLSNIALRVKDVLIHGTRTCWLHFFLRIQN